MKKSFVKLVGTGGFNPPGTEIGYVRLEGENITVVRNKSVATAFSPKRIKKFMAEHPNSLNDPHKFVTC